MRTTLSIATLAFVAVQAHGQLVLPYAGTDPSAYISSFQITKSGTAGRANTLYISNASNTSDVLLVNTVGLGRAGYFTTTNAANVQMALRADSNGGGYSFFGLMTGTGKAGLFRIINPANADNALQAQTTGSGAAFRSIAGTGLAGEFVGNVAVRGSVDASFIIGNGSFVTAVNAELLDGLDSTAFLQSVPNPLTLVGASDTHIIRGENSSTVAGASGIIGHAGGSSGSTYGGRFQSDSTSGRGVFASASALNGLTYAGLFENYSTSGYGVYAVAYAQSGTNYGGYFASNSTTGHGVRGIAAAASGLTKGGSFVSNSTTGRGVEGYATAATGGNHGGVFQSNSTNGIGAFGTANAVSGINYGLVGNTYSTSGRGVYGLASAVSGITYGVYGNTSSPVDGYAVFAQGRSGASGVKSFRIDHPFNPEHEYLLHYSAEGPEPLNVYSGNAQTDSKGYATIPLPDYFEEINKDPRYTLTVVGGAGEDFVQVRVVRKIHTNQFTIRTSAPNIEVSWEVKAIRNDLWVRKYGAPVEKMKQGVEKGTYQHPELYGKPKEMGMNYRPEDEKPADRPKVQTLLKAPTKR